MPEETTGVDNSAISEDMAAAIRSVVQQVVADSQSEQDKQRGMGATILTPPQRDRGPEVMQEKEKGISAARLVRALAATRNDPERALAFVQKQKWDDRPGESVEKALAAGQFTGGGFMIPEDMANEIIDLLRPRSVVRRAGAQTVPMPRGTLTLPKTTGDASASYVGENNAIPSSQPTGGQIEMAAKKLAALVPISNDLLLYSASPSADTWVRDNLVRRIAVREDAAFIRDDGLSSTPKGLRNWAASANVTATNGTTATQIETDFRELIDALEGADVDMTNPVWLMNPRSKNHLLTLRDANGNLIYPEIRSATPTAHTFPVMTTNNIPKNLGGGSESEIYLVNFSDVIIGEAGTMEITMAAEASYNDGANTISAFQNDQTLIRAIVRHDLAVQHDEAIAVKTGIAY